MNDAGRVIILPKGEYVATTTYYPLDAVIYNGNTYVAIKETTGNLPTDENYWKIFIKGATLMQGATADADGAAGYIPKPLIADKDKFFKGDGTWAEVQTSEQVSNPNLLDNGWFNVNSRGQSEYGMAFGGYLLDRWKGINCSATLHGDYVTFHSSYGIRQNLNIKHEIKKGDTLTISALIKIDDEDCKKLLFELSDENDQKIMSKWCEITTFREWYIFKYTGKAIISLDATKTCCFWCLTSTKHDSGGADIHIKAIKLELGSVSTLHLDTAPNPEEEKLRCITSTADPLDTFANKTLQQPTGDEWSPTKTYNVGDMFIAGNQLWKTKVQHSGVIPAEGDYVTKTSVVEELKRLNNSSETQITENGITFNLNRIGNFGMITASIGNGTLDKIIHKEETILALPEGWRSKLAYVECMECSGIRLVLSQNKLITYTEIPVETPLRFSMIYPIKLN